MSTLLQIAQSVPNYLLSLILCEASADICISAFDILDKLDYKADEIEITDMWANVLKKNETHQPHTHSNNFLSGVFYIDADDTMPGIGCLLENSVSQKNFQSLM